MFKSDYQKLKLEATIILFYTPNKTEQSVTPKKSQNQILCVSTFQKKSLSKLKVYSFINS